MGYYVRLLSWKKSAPNWKVQYVSYKKADSQDSNAKKPKKEWDVNPDRWRALGFHKSMTIEEARARAKQINAQDFLKGQEERIKKLEEEEAQLIKRRDSVLPIQFVEEFEKRFVKSEDAQTLSGKRKRSRASYIWNSAKRIIFKLQIEPSEWFYYSKEVYDYFYQEQISLHYASSILNFSNLWGFFICRKLGKPFLPIQKPRGYERQRIIDAFYEKERRSRRPSRGLSPEELNSIRGRINQENFNWLFLSVWLGLRPQEIDNLKNQDFLRLETPMHGKKILWVFQTKIIALPPEDRWKPIPILFEEQEFALRIIESKNFKRPLCKTLKKYFGGGLDLYGGRKGFTDLMLAKGHTIENISVWMGHSTLERTWRSYKARRKFHL